MQGPGPVNIGGTGRVRKPAVRKHGMSVRKKRMTQKQMTGKEGEDMARIPLVSPLLHTHIALLEGRKYPVRKSEEAVSFFSALREAGYDGRMSIEGSSDDWTADSAAALEVLRDLDGGING